MDLKSLNLQELSVNESREIDGGVAPAIAVAAAVGVGLGVIVVGAAVGYGIYCLVSWATR